jgi:hypothetical protein
MIEVLDQGRAVNRRSSTARIRIAGSRRGETEGFPRLSVVPGRRFARAGAFGVIAIASDPRVALGSAWDQPPGVIPRPLT